MMKKTMRKKEKEICRKLLVLSDLSKLISE